MLMLDFQNINIAVGYASTVILWIWCFICVFIIFYTVYLFIHTTLSELYWETANEEEFVENIYSYMLEYYSGKNIENIEMQKTRISVLNHIKNLDYDDYKNFYVYLINNGMRKRYETYNH